MIGTLGKKHSPSFLIPIWPRNWNRALKNSTTIAISYGSLRKISNLWNNDHWIQFPCLGGLSLLAKGRQEGSQADQSSHWRCCEEPNRRYRQYRSLEAQPIRMVFQAHYSRTQDDLQGFRQYAGNHFLENTLWDLGSSLTVINFLS